MKVEQKLREMGLELPELPKPNGLYAPSRRVGNLMITFYSIVRLLVHCRIAFSAFLG